MIEFDMGLGLIVGSIMAIIFMIWAKRRNTIRHFLGDYYNKPLAKKVKK